VSGRKTIPWVTGVLIRLHFLPILIPFLPLAWSSLELEDRKTKPYSGRSSEPTEVFLAASKLGFRLGWRRV
jgi:hypothetical protein